jgi:hypothetical protein
MFEPLAWFGDELAGVGLGRAEKKYLGTFAWSRAGGYRALGAKDPPEGAHLVTLLDAHRRLLVRDGRLRLLDLPGGAERDTGLAQSTADQPADWGLSLDGTRLVLLERLRDADVWVADLR